MNDVRVVLMLLGCAASALPLWATAHEDHAALLEELVVYGRAEQRIGQALSASEGLVGYDDIQLPPLWRVGDLAEAVPGMVATQHSGTGKANQYFLRGFNLDHGTDFAATLDGVPLNMRTHGHGQGYLDLNHIIPELVATTRYRKGPYHAEVGDFSSAGSVAFELYDQLPEDFVTATVGEHGYRRGLAALDGEMGSARWLGAVDFTRYESPWEIDENLRQLRWHSSIQVPLGARQLKLSLHGYDSRWGASDQIPERAVESGRIDLEGFIDPDLGGETTRYALTARLDDEQWRVQAYALRYDFTLFSNFTYLLENPTGGDQFEQRDDRWVYGASASGWADGLFGRDNVDVEWGFEARYDDIDEVGLHATERRRRPSTLRADQVSQWSVGGYGSLGVSLGALRLAAGLRADAFGWDVDARLDANDGSGTDVQLSPKLTLAYRLADNAELYANYGRGMHSNDVRGETIRIDPATGEAAAPVDVLTPSDGYELGARYELGDRFNVALAAFWLELDSELVFVGDAGGTETNGASERRGVELTMFYRPTEWLAFDLDAARTHARFEDAPSGERRIPGSIETSASLGANLTLGSGFTASLSVRYLGESPLLEDNSVRADSALLVHAGLGFQIARTQWRLEAFNLLDSDDRDISYFYGSRLAGEPAGGVEDVHFRPLEPRSLRLSVRWML